MLPNPAMFSKTLLVLFALSHPIAAINHEYRAEPSLDRHGLAKRAIEMELWNPRADDVTRDIFDGLEQANSNRYNHPTYQLKLPLNHFQTDDDMVKKAYDNIVSKVRQTPTILVAKLKVPSGPYKGNYFSTVPDGPGLGWLLRYKDHAPAWKHAIGTRNPDVLHAEDGVEMYFELMNPETNAEFQYPAETVMTVYGRINGGTVGIKQACSDTAAGAPNPTCAQVKANLNIG